MLSQTAALVRRRSADNPLRAYAVDRVYMTGYSQTAGYARTYAIAIAPFARRPGGGPICDGYLAGGQAPFNVVITTCTPMFKPDDPRLAVANVGGPYVDVAGEGDTQLTYLMRRPDGDTAPDLFRRYEIAGATHSGATVTPYTPRQADLDRSHSYDTSTVGCLPSGPPLSAFPMPDAMQAMWVNLDRWVTRQVAPPHGTPISLQDGPGHRIAIKDRFGNAPGGVRTTAVDVPIATWHSSRGGKPSCMRVGYASPFDAARLESLYPTKAGYVAKVIARAPTSEARQANCRFTGSIDRGGARVDTMNDRRRQA